MQMVHFTLLAKPSLRDRVQDIRFGFRPRALPSAPICVPFRDIDQLFDAEGVRYLRSGQRPDLQTNHDQGNPERVTYWTVRKTGE